jgi:taurine dioxygenase
MGANDRLACAAAGVGVGVALAWRCLSANPASAVTEAADFINATHGMRVRALEPFGVEISGVESLAKCDDAAIKAMVDAMDTTGHGVLVIKNQDLTPAEIEEAIMKFGPYFGGEPLPYIRWPGQSPNVPGCPHLATLGNYRAKRANEFGMECAVGDPIAEFKPAKDEISEWHTDGSFLDKPKVAIALYAHPAGALPAEGGETRFASCAKGYDALSPDVRSQIEGLASVHSWGCFMRFLEARDPGREKVTEADIAAKPDMAWPLVRTHPRTGRRSLYINPKNTRAVLESADWPVDPAQLAADGKRVAPTPISSHAHASTEKLDATQTAVLETMNGDEEGVKYVHGLASAVLDSGVYAHRWELGDFVIWDNRVLLHAASAFDASKYERFLFRMEFPGETVLKEPLA